jgi:hypothetical protein
LVAAADVPQRLAFWLFLRAFVQLKSSLEEGREPGPRPVDRERLDFEQAFIDFSHPRTNLPADKSWLTLRLGRQEIDFGEDTGDGLYNTPGGVILPG